MNVEIIENMVLICAEVFGINSEEITSPKRTRVCVLARSLIADIAYKEYLFTYYAIGKALNRDHATIMHAITTLANDSDQIPELKYLRRQVFNKSQDVLQQRYWPYICD